MTREFVRLKKIKTSSENNSKITIFNLRDVQLHKLIIDHLELKWQKCLGYINILKLKITNDAQKMVYRFSFILGRWDCRSKVSIKLVIIMNQFAKQTVIKPNIPTLPE
jgi:hypothetical protein